MSNALRTRATVMAELLELTNKMVNKRKDADFLIEGVEKRQSLMDEFDTLPVDELTEQDIQVIKQSAKDILQKDKIINVELEQMQKESRQDLNASHNQQRVLNYANNALANAGSYMDFKK